ncbi:MAG: hypothetical protein UT53_C0021G0005 [Candidatus Yanofskybacteria bacterium GW2011_GWD2_39_48]|uniref:UPF0235 protein UT53_C0021G0005 n=1 Tax=Candidatus Yanofskybacteria bacterium GW2011_GWD2_39_48 TaxID=1619031 RepID=A0A0G0P600_9BACT|nr:MAG: hypothetical protein UT53_C0021G0005 [Candidatus Yanofskybacteria bacterium GW2011_GWD2_39_48]
MRINIKAKPSARENKVEKIDEINYIVSVKEPPIQGQANQAIIKLLAEYFNISSIRVKIVIGHTSRNKIIEIT